MIQTYAGVDLEIPRFATSERNSNAHLHTLHQAMFGKHLRLLLVLYL